MYKSVEDPAVLEARRKRVQKNIKQKEIEKPQPVQHKKLSPVQQTMSNMASALVASIITFVVFGLGFLVVDQINHDPNPELPKPMSMTQCVETVVTGCNWAGQEYRK